MRNFKQPTVEDIDKMIKTAKESKGEEDTDVYRLKIDNLNTLKSIVRNNHERKSRNNTKDTGREKRNFAEKT